MISDQTIKKNLWNEIQQPCLKVYFGIPYTFNIEIYLI